MEDLHKPLFWKLRGMVSTFAHYMLDVVYAMELPCSQNLFWNSIMKSCTDFQVLIDKSFSRVFRDYDKFKDYYSLDIIGEYKYLDWKDARTYVNEMHDCLISICKSWDSLVSISDFLSKKDSYVARTIGEISDALDSWQEFLIKNQPRCKV